MTTDLVIKVDSAEQSDQHRLVRSAKRLLDVILVGGATATAVSLLAGLVISLIDIFFFRHPNVGWADNIVRDAEAVATGHLQYGNPATEFVGLPYAPVDTFLVAGLLKIYWWAGWEQVVSMLAVAAAMVSLVRMLWATTFRLEGRLATASVVVALSLGGLFTIPGFYSEGVDQLAWCLMVVAGSVTFRGLLSPTGLSRRQMIVTGLLLTGSIFSKQTTIVPCLVLAVLTLAAPIFVESGRTSTWRTWVNSATVLLTFAGTSAFLGIALQVASQGYAYDLMVDGQLRYGRIIPLGQQIGTSLRILTVPLAALVALVVCVSASLFADRGRRQRLHVVVAGSAVVVAVSPIPTAILAQAKLGGGSNQLAGPVWTLTLGCAVLLLLLRPSVRKLAAAAIACCVLLAGIGPVTHVMADHQLGSPKLYQQATWSGTDPFLLAAVSRGEGVYDLSYPSLSVSPKAPGYPAEDVLDVLAAGYTPRWFIQDLLEGRYALVKPFSEANDPITDWIYTSNLGRYDGSFLWKIDLLLELGYTPVTDPVSGVVYDRPTSRLKQLGWFSGCFGPYQARDAGVDIRMSGSGGLFCIDHGDLHLRGAPGLTTDIVIALAEGTGEAALRFGAVPQILRVTPLDDRHLATQSDLDIARSGSEVTKCLAHDGATTTLTLRAVHGQGAVNCNIATAGRVLDVPVADGGSTSHVSIQLAALDSPTLIATSSNGRPVPFTLQNPSPADIKSL